MKLGMQLARFVVAGGISALLDFGVLWVLMGLDVDYVAAKAVSFVAGTTCAYLINRRWTFAAERSKRRFAAVMLLYGVTFVVQVGIFAFSYPLILQVLGEQLWAQLGTFVFAQGIATCVNFIVQRVVIFRDATLGNSVSDGS